MKDLRVDIEGMPPDELLAMLTGELEPLVFGGDPIVFGIGTASVLGRFEKRDASLLVELAQIDGGGEGVLSTLWHVAVAFAESNHLEQIEWIVHAVNCADPNLKLRKLLDRLGFEVRKLPTAGKVYHRIYRTGQSYRAGAR